MTDIAVDTSAIVELMTEGRQADAVDKTLRAAGGAFVTPVRDWRLLALQEVPVDSSMTEIAIDAFELWGKGRARARLNFGDCFSYALARSRNLPLLCVGNDFRQTDLQTL